MIGLSQVTHHVGTLSPLGNATLEDAIAYGQITLVNGNELFDHLVIEGFFEMNNTDPNVPFIKHLNATIEMNNNANMDITATVDYVSCLFDSDGTGKLTIDANSVDFNGTDFTDLKYFNITDIGIQSIEDCNFTDIADGITVKETDAYIRDCVFNDSPVILDASTGNPEDARWGSYRCQYTNAVGKNAVTVNKGIFIGGDAEFTNCAKGIYMDANSSNSSIAVCCADFTNITEDAVLAIDGARVTVKGMTFNNCARCVTTNNNSEFVVLEKLNIQNCPDGIDSDGDGLLRIEDVTINTMTGGNTPCIQVNDNKGGIVRGNEIYLSDRGIKLTDCDGITVDDNTIGQVTGLGISQNLFEVRESTNITFTNNIVNGGSALFRGYHFAMIGDSEIKNNDATGCYLEMSVSSCDGTRIEGNHLLGGSGNHTSLSTKISHSMVYECNRFENSTAFGAKFSGNVLPLNFMTNNMENNPVGLLYDGDVMADKQIDRGNIWLNNPSWGGQFNTTFQPQIEMAQYFMMNLPTRDPSNWFQSTSVTPPTCVYRAGLVDGNGDWDEIAALVQSLDCAALGIGDGYCMMNQMVANMLLQDYPQWLSDPDLSSFQTAHDTTSLSELPLPLQILKDLPQLNVNNTAPSIIWDTINEEFINETTWLNYQNAQKNDMTLQRQNRDQVLGDYIAQVNAVNTSDPLELDYIEMILLLLEQLKHNHILSSTEEQAVINMAENCVATYGPAVYVAQLLAEANELTYAPSTACPRNSEEISKEDMMNDYIYPNPSSNYFIFDNLNEDRELYIYNLMGVPVLEKDISEIKTIRVDVSNLSNGVYIIKTDKNEISQKLLIHR